MREMATRRRGVVALSFVGLCSFCAFALRWRHCRRLKPLHEFRALLAQSRANRARTKSRRHLMTKLAVAAELGVTNDDLRFSRCASVDSLVLERLRTCNSLLLDALKPRKKYKKLTSRCRVREQLLAQLAARRTSRPTKRSSKKRGVRAAAPKPLAAKPEWQFAQSIFPMCNDSGSGQVPAEGPHSSIDSSARQCVLLALTFGGFEHVCVNEIHRTLSVPLHDIAVLAPDGKLVPGAVVQVSQMQSIESFDNLTPPIPLVLAHCSSPAIGL